MYPCGVLDYWSLPAVGLNVKKPVNVRAMVDLVLPGPSGQRPSPRYHWQPPFTCARALNPVLLPLSIVCTALWAWFAVAPLAPADIDLSTALSMGLEAPWGDRPAMGFAFGLPLGFLWLGVFWPAKARLRWHRAVGVVLALCMLAVALQVGEVFYKPQFPGPGGLLGQALGFGLGGLLWWLLGSRLLHQMPRLNGPWWPILVLSAVLTAILPLDLATPMVGSGLSGSWPEDMPQRLYGLIKVAMLWVPLGFLMVLAGLAEMVPRLGLALPIALVLMGWPHLGDMPWGEVLELVFALPGLWLGGWLGKGTRLARLPLDSPLAKKRTAGFPSAQLASTSGCRGRVPANGFPRDCIPRRLGASKGISAGGVPWQSPDLGQGRKGIN